ncbi:MAG: tyrosine-type recombinase/integrase [Pirellulales bacterium]
MSKDRRSRRQGRQSGSRNKGYWFRDGRGWFCKVNGRGVPLTNEAGERLRDPNDDAAAKLAHARVLTAKRVEAVKTCDLTVLEVVSAYLRQLEAEKGRNKTFHDRAKALFNFTHGLGLRFLALDGEEKPKPRPSDYVHAGYKDRPVMSIKGIDVDQWVQANKRWKSDSTKRTMIKALKRAINYCVGAGLIPANPIRGFKVPKDRARITYLTPEQETALCDAANPALAMAIRVLIRTGMRPGCEFAKVTAKHVQDDGTRIKISLSTTESKTKNQRIIFVADPATLATIRDMVKKYPSGPIFRNGESKAWTVENMGKQFRALKESLARVSFDDDVVLYSCRHTYAKRVLSGYWSGKPTNIETLATLMGNSPKICRDHYLQWDESGNESLWSAA